MCEPHEPRSSSAVRESRFTAAGLEEREVERFVAAEATFCLAPFIVEKDRRPKTRSTIGRRLSVDSILEDFGIPSFEQKRNKGRCE